MSTLLEERKVVARKSTRFSVPADQTVVIRATSVNANVIGVAFDTPNGNQPSDFGNQVLIWQSGNQIPWSSQAEDAQAVGINTPSGDLAFTDLDVTHLSYIIGYSVGPLSDNAPLFPNVVASVFIPATDSAQLSEITEASVIGESFSPSIGANYIGSTSLIANYNMLSGFVPNTAGSYVGVWEGTAASYTTTPKWVQAISSANSSGTVSINNIKLTRGTSYTLGLFASGYASDPASLRLTTLTATSTFTV